MFERCGTRALSVSPCNQQSLAKRHQPKNIFFDPKLTHNYQLANTC